jgi:hypothetical protein
LVVVPSTASEQNVAAAAGPSPGAWVRVAPDGSVIPAPYLSGAPTEATPGASGPADLLAGSSSAPAAGQRGHRAGLAVFGAAALTAVLAVVAPFLVVWRYGFSNGSFAAQTVVNGWGSVSARPASFASSHSHDTDYGLVMVSAAVFLLAGAAVYAVTRRAVAAVLPTSVGATLAAGTALVLALDRGGRDSATTGTDTWAVGAGFWLIVAAGGLGVVVVLAAAVLTALDLRAESGTPHLAPGPDAARYDDRVWVAPPNPSRYGAPDPARYVSPDPAGFAPPWAP